MSKNSWLANAVLGTYGETQGVRNLQLEISIAPKIRISEDVISVWTAFYNLDLEDLSSLMQESEFPDALLWVEWPTNDSFLPFWAETIDDKSVKEMGAIIKTGADRRSGMIQFIAGGQNLMILPLSLGFDWHKEFCVPQESMEDLKISLENLGFFTKNGIRLSDKYIESALKIRSKFSVFPSPYLDISFFSSPNLEPIYNNSFKYNLYMEPLMCSLANILECCFLETWKPTKLRVH